MEKKKEKVIGLGKGYSSSYFQFKGRTDIWKPLIPNVLFNLYILPNYEHIYSSNLFS